MYNFILAGLVKEFIAIGASEDFKDAVYNIWMLYLTKLEILSQKNDIPKLSALYKKRDAEIVYNRSSRRKKRVRSNSVSAMTITNSGDIDSRSMGREIAKQKRALARAEYEQYTNTQQSDHSLLNQTLTSLASDEESSECVGRIRFSEVAKRELLKTMTKKHLEEHEFDVDHKLTCHKINRLLVSDAFLQGPAMLTRNKLYSIIYIALLLTESQYQLSDIIRFCREGHLSYLQYKHFFPEIYSEKEIDETLYQNGYKSLFTYGYIRKTAMDIYKFVDIKKCDYSPDLIDLCRRYCTELNLPDQIFNIASDLIDKTKPQFNTNKKMTAIPNFEDAVQLVKILKVYYPKLVDLHNYVPRNGTLKKLENWNTLNRKVLCKLGLQLSQKEIENIAKCVPGSVEMLLFKIKAKISKEMGELMKNQESIANDSDCNKDVSRIESDEVFEQEIQELDTTTEAVEMLRRKISNMETLLNLKDQRISDLQHKLDKCMTSEKTKRGLFEIFTR
ncbi:TATA box-binding protein-associated factor RNA polymerase I subunit B [Carabus blaptoides fortunei]